jgi:hypothetical protein
MANGYSVIQIKMVISQIESHRKQHFPWNHLDHLKSKLGLSNGATFLRPAGTSG